MGGGGEVGSAFYSRFSAENHIYVNWFAMVLKFDIFQFVVQFVFCDVQNLY